MRNDVLMKSPQSRAGRLAQVLLIGSVVLFVMNQVVVALLNDLRESMVGQVVVQVPLVVWILVGFVMLGVGFAASVSALIAIVRHQERSWVLWLALLPGLFVVFLLVGEFLIAPFE